LKKLGEIGDEPEHNKACGNEIQHSKHTLDRLSSTEQCQALGHQIDSRRRYRDHCAEGSNGGLAWG
jgi:hypothetical protein